ncbi:MAG: hypothetical protein IT292_10590 [Deltaproteobacteria bacterium]|nr:hypothetical protein [Deltaproteobacteria bacterium]
MLKKIFTENLSLKLIALMLAVLLKLYFFSSDNMVQESVELPIVVQNIPNSLILVKPRETAAMKVQVKLRGPSPLIEQYRTRNPQLRVDLPMLHARGDKAVTQQVKLRKYLDVPNGIDIVELLPSEVDLEFDRLIKKELLVVPNYIGQPAPGYRLEDVRALPESVVATGPAHELANVAAVQTEEVDVSRFTSPQRLSLTLVEQSSFISFNVNLVTLELKLSPIYMEKSISNVPIKVRAADGYAASVEPSKATILLNGPMKSLEAVSEEVIEVYVDAENMAVGEHQADLNLSLPRNFKNVQMINSNPRQVTLRIVNKYE